MQSVFNATVWGVAILVNWFVWAPSQFRQPGHRYVAQTGSDLWGNGSSARPWRTIQHAADSARVGDVIHVFPGVYRERIHLRHGGEPGNPLRLIADPPGSVVVTGASTPSECERVSWKDEENGIYSTEIGWAVHMVRVDGQQLFRIPWGGVARLKEVAGRDDSLGAFWSENGYLFLALPGGRRPESARVVWNQRVPPAREWGDFKSANVWIEADHIFIMGFRFEFGLGAAIRVWNASDFAVEDCEFTGCAHGVQAGFGVKPAIDLRVERCWYHNTPQGDWAKSWLTWNEVYSAYSSSTLCASGDRPVKVCNNLVTDFGDALRISPSPNPEQEGAAELVGNWLAFGTDDAFELDGGGHRVLVSKNVVIDVHEGVSLSPLTDGPVLIKDNLFWNPTRGLNGAQLKFVPPETVRGNAARITGIQIESNVFCGDWLSWRADISVTDVELRNNFFSIDRQLTPPWPSGVKDDDNSYRLPRDPSQRTAYEFLSASAVGEADTKINLAIRRTTELLDTRPGPSWLKWENHPRTLRLLRMVGSRR